METASKNSGTTKGDGGEPEVAKIPSILYLATHDGTHAVGGKESVEVSKKALSVKEPASEVHKYPKITVPGGEGVESSFLEVTNMSG